MSKYTKNFTYLNSDLQLTFEKILFAEKKHFHQKRLDIQLNFEKFFFPNILPCVSYQKMDRSIREAVIRLNRINIMTNSSEGGGGQRHGAPDYAYIEAKLSNENIDTCKKLNILLDKIYDKQNSSGLLFNGSALSYGKQTSYYIIGFKRKKLTDKMVKNRFRQYISKLKPEVGHY